MYMYFKEHVWPKNALHAKYVPEINIKKFNVGDCPHKKHYFLAIRWAW